MPIITVRQGKVIAVENDGDYIGALVEYYDSEMNLIESVSVEPKYPEGIGDTGNESEFEKL